MHHRQILRIIPGPSRSPHLPTNLPRFKHRTERTLLLIVSINSSRSLSRLPSIRLFGPAFLTQRRAIARRLIHPSQGSYQSASQADITASQSAAMPSSQSSTILFLSSISFLSSGVGSITSGSWYPSMCPLCREIQGWV